MKNVGLALHNYAETHGVFPYGFDSNEALWSAMILPQIEQGPLFDTLLFQEDGAGNWFTNGSTNEKACGTVISVFVCPSMATETQRDNANIPGRAAVSYRACAGSDSWSDDRNTLQSPPAPAGAKSLEQAGLNGMFWGSSRVRFADVFDGLTNTIMLGESYTDDYTKDGQQMDYWHTGSPQIDDWRPGGTDGTEFTEALGSTGPKMNSRLDPTQHGTIMEIAFGSYHAGGAHFTLGDGIRAVPFRKHRPSHLSRAWLAERQGSPRRVLESVPSPLGRG